MSRLRLGLWGFELLHSPMWAGRIRNASPREAVSERHTTIGTTLMNFPITSGRSMRGRKAAMVVRQAVKTGAATSVVPIMAASFGFIPC